MAFSVLTNYHVRKLLHGDILEARFFLTLGDVAQTPHTLGGSRLPNPRRQGAPGGRRAAARPAANEGGAREGASERGSERAMGASERGGERERERARGERARGRSRG